MKTEVNFEEYIARMENMTDKVTILDYIPKNARVLDFGCGSGPLSQYFTKDNYVGYDIAEDMVERARKDNRGYTFTADLKTLSKDKFDAVIFSSLLHEVYSYNGFSFTEVIKVLKQSTALLQSNGVVIIRDGIQPTPQDTVWKLPLKNTNDTENFLAHLNSTSPQRFSCIIENGALVGPPVDIISFLNIYTWGWESVEREKYEKVNFATLEQWLSLISSAGLKMLELNIISQEDYFFHLEKIVSLEGRSWPTKLFIVAKQQ